MPYSTKEEVRLALAPNGDPDGDLGTAAALSDEQIDNAITEADAQVDGRLSNRYSVPFDGDPPALVKTLSQDIAAYLSTLTYQRTEPITDDHPVRLRYARALVILDQLAEGDIDLIGATGPESLTGEAHVVNPYDGALFQLSDFALETAPGLTAPDPARWPMG